MLVARSRLVCRQTASIARRHHSTIDMEQRNYAAAVAALNTLQSNFAIVDAIRKSGRGMNKAAIPEMIEWCGKIGYKPSDFDKVRPIHIAGTKGKGSTSAFISSILSQYTSTSEAHSQPSKIGLYTSPHLRFVRERIQIDNEPISEEKFAQYFFEVWDKLEAAAKAENAPADVSTKPVYFRYLTLMALHAYMHEGVDSAVIECGIGGEYDSTNILTKPTVTAVTSLGIDHTAMLGSTLPEIAWHKAGIFKSGSVAFTAPQKEEAMTVLQQRAAEKGTDLHIINLHPSLANGSVKLGLSADFQKVNASVAIAAAAAHLRALGHASIPDPTQSDHIELPTQFVKGLEQVRWSGRCEIRREKNLAWHIDGAHTLESIEVTGRWFAEQIESASAAATTASHSTIPRVLIFNQQTRDASSLAKALYTALQSGITSGSKSPFTHVIFTTNQTFSDGYRPDLVSMNTDNVEVDALAVQKALATTWSEIDSTAEVRVMRTIEEAVSAAREVAHKWANDPEQELMVLVTGSLHLVGGALEVLESGTEKR